MTNTVKVLFHSDAEAMAFVAGVNYVNDSAVRVTNVTYSKKNNSWQVELEDQDSFYSEDEGWIYDLTNPDNFLFNFSETEDDDVED